MFEVHTALWSNISDSILKNPSKNSPEKATMCFSTFHLIFSILGCAYLKLMSDSTTLNIIYMLAAGGKDVLTQKMMKIYGIFFMQKTFSTYIFLLHT